MSAAAPADHRAAAAALRAARAAAAAGLALALAACGGGAEREALAGPHGLREIVIPNVDGDPWPRLDCAAAETGRAIHRPYFARTSLPKTTSHGTFPPPAAGRTPGGRWIHVADYAFYPRRQDWAENRHQRVLGLMVVAEVLRRCPRS